MGWSSTGIGFVTDLNSVDQSGLIQKLDQVIRPNSAPEYQGRLGRWMTSSKAVHIASGRVRNRHRPRRNSVVGAGIAVMAPGSGRRGKKKVGRRLSGWVGGGKQTFGRFSVGRRRRHPKAAWAADGEVKQGGGDGDAPAPPQRVGPTITARPDCTAAPDRMPARPPQARMGSRIGSGERERKSQRRE